MIGQQHASPCDTLKPEQEIFLRPYQPCTPVERQLVICLPMFRVQEIHKYWYLNGWFEGPGNPVTGGPGTKPLQSPGWGSLYICLVSEIATAVGIVCRDTVCRIITVPQQPIIALCDTEATII
ncbi:MAG: hypothetical protein R3B47_21555 [Bacteroidia bacterium]